MRPLLAVVAVALSPLAFAQVTLDPLVTDHAVLQRDAPIFVRGRAQPGEVVEVLLGSRSTRATARSDGSFVAQLEPLSLTKEPLELVARTASGEARARDLLVGDVWLCSGQSNMDWSLGASDSAEDVPQANLPLVRHFGVEMSFASVPQVSVRGSWSVTTPESVPGWTAVGFYFARRVHAETGVPIGLLRSTVGGTNIECWMSQDTLLGDPKLEPFAVRMRESLAQYQRELADALPSVERWAAAARDALARGLPIPQRPEWPEYPFGERMFRPRCVTLHNGMIAPLAPLRVRGFLWYQGESNAGPASECEQYIEKMRALVSDWRRDFGGGAQLPFYYVQLAAWLAPTSDPGHSDDWALLRDAQRRALALPGFGMASAIDIGDAADIHPRNKFDVGERLALWALRNEYGRELVPSGPLYRAMRVEGAAIRLEFDFTGSGLMVGHKSGRAPAQPAKEAKLARFAIAGEDRAWRWAEARIDGTTVLVSHPDVATPVAVRYAWSVNPEGANLYNRDGLPASPFRTDAW